MSALIVVVIPAVVVVPVVVIVVIVVVILVVVAAALAAVVIAVGTVVVAEIAPEVAAAPISHARAPGATGAARVADVVATDKPVVACDVAHGAVVTVEARGAVASREGVIGICAVGETSSGFGFRIYNKDE